MDQDEDNAFAAPAGGHSVVERQVIYGDPPHEANYWVVWAVWDRWVQTFLAMLFRSPEEAERHVARLRAEEEGGGLFPARAGGLVRRRWRGGLGAVGGGGEQRPDGYQELGDGERLAHIDEGPGLCCAFQRLGRAGDHQDRKSTRLNSSHRRLDRKSVV